MNNHLLGAISLLCELKNVVKLDLMASNHLICIFNFFKRVYRSLKNGLTFVSFFNVNICRGIYEIYGQISVNFLVTVKAAPHECANRTGLL